MLKVFFFFLLIGKNKKFLFNFFSIQKLTKLCFRKNVSFVDIIRIVSVVVDNDEEVKGGQKILAEERLSEKRRKSYKCPTPFLLQFCQAMKLSCQRSNEKLLFNEKVMKKSKKAKYKQTLHLVFYTSI